MRVIAGEFGSRLLKAPRGMDTRPTLAKTREALFSMLQGSVQGADVLDLFAGSGALGIEAVSRGARSAVLCDHAAEAARAIRANIAALGIPDRVTFLKTRWEGALDRLEAEGRSFDLIFLDPPYAMPLPPVMAALLKKGLLAADGLIIAEHGAQREVLPPEGMAVHRHRAYGDSAITVFAWEEASHAHSDFPREL